MQRHDDRSTAARFVPGACTPDRATHESHGAARWTPYAAGCSLLALALAPALHAQQDPAPVWVPVGTGTTLDAAGDASRVTVRYARSSGQAFGTARALPPELGAASGLRLRIAPVEGEGTVLLVSMRAEDGAVHSWPMQTLDAGEALEVDLAYDRLRPDPFQNRGRDPGPFDLRRVRALSITDIGGYLGAAAGPVAWTVTDLRPSATGAAADDAEEPATAAEQVFFAALVDGRGAAEDTVRPLLVDAISRPRAARPRLLLGLAHLWIAAEGDRTDATLLEHLMLAERWFGEFARVGGRDPRLPSWEVPARLAAVRTLGLDGAGLRAPLDAAQEEDPGFHGFAVGLLGFGEPRGSDGFARGLRAVRATLRQRDPEDPSLRNAPRWPHNREGFLLFAADYEQRAGNVDEALALLRRIEAVPEFGDWPFRDEVPARRASWKAGGTDGADSGAWMPGRSCAVCHRRGGR